MAASKKKHQKPWVLILFSLPFAGVGLGFLLLSVIPSLYQWTSMQSWQPVSAQLLKADTRVHRGDGTTYEAIAKYRYQFAGRDWQSKRVGIMTGADNIGSWQQDHGRMLERALAKGNSIRVFVNPQNPAEAVIYPEMRWGLLGFKLIFVLVFGGVGLGLLFYAITHRDRSQPQMLDTPEPWLANKDWQNPIKSNSKANMVGSLFFAGIWNLISMPLLFVVPEEVEQGNYPALIGLLFPLVGIGLIIWAWVSFNRWRRFGSLQLILDPWPGSIGGQVGGSLQLPLSANSGLQPKISLSCVRSYYSGSGKNRKRREKLLWQKQGVAELRPVQNGSRLSFLFDIPEGLPASELSDNDYHLWRLQIAAELQGADLQQEFELPVFPTQNASTLQQTSTDAHPQVSEENYQKLEELLNAKPLPGGVELDLGIFRNPALNGGGVIFGLVFAAIGIFLAFTDAPWIMPVVFTIMGTLFALGFAYALLNRYRVRIGERGLYTERYLLGVRVRKRFVPPEKIKHLAIKSSGSSQMGSRQTEHFVINAILTDGTKVPVVESLNGRGMAEQALDTLELLSGFNAAPASANG